MDRQLYPACTVSAVVHRSRDSISWLRLLVGLSIFAHCADGEACGHPLPSRIVKAGLILATVLVAVALGFDFIAPFFAQLLIGESQ